MRRGARRAASRERAALRDAEPVLLVDDASRGADRERQRRRAGPACRRASCTRPRRQSSRSASRARGRRGAGQQREAQRRAARRAAPSVRRCCSASTSVGHHHQRLAARRRDQRRGAERHGGLAAADVADEQAPHRPRAPEVARDLVERRAPASAVSVKGSAARTARGPPRRSARRPRSGAPSPPARARRRRNASLRHQRAPRAPAGGAPAPAPPAASAGRVRAARGGAPAPRPATAGPSRARAPPAVNRLGRLGRRAEARERRRGASSRARAPLDALDEAVARPQAEPPASARAASAAVHHRRRDELARPVGRRAQRPGQRDVAALGEALRHAARGTGTSARARTCPPVLDEDVEQPAREDVHARSTVPARARPCPSADARQRRERRRRAQIVVPARQPHQQIAHRRARPAPRAAPPSPAPRPAASRAAPRTDRRRVQSIA